MNLKKSDKMIAGIAVLVLIIAAVGIVLYSEDKDDVILDDGDGKMMSYEVNVDDTPFGSADPDNTDYQVSTKKNGDYIGDVDIGVQNINSVTFKVDYTDKFTGIFGFGIIKMFGQDTITITVSDMNDNVIDTQDIKGSGNATITIDGITDMISTAPIKAESKAEAEEMLEERYENNPMNVTYKVKVSISYGELRIIKKLRERIISKDYFTLEINYDYYRYTLGEPEPVGGGNPPTSMPATSDYTTYYSTSFPGYK